MDRAETITAVQGQEPGSGSASEEAGGEAGAADSPVFCIGTIYRHHLPIPAVDEGERKGSGAVRDPVFLCLPSIKSRSLASSFQLGPDPKCYQV